MTASNVLVKGIIAEEDALTVMLLLGAVLTGLQLSSFAMMKSYPVKSLFVRSFADPACFFTILQINPVFESGFFI